MSSPPVRIALSYFLKEYNYSSIEGSIKGSMIDGNNVDITHYTIDRDLRDTARLYTPYKKETDIDDRRWRNPHQ